MSRLTNAALRLAAARTIPPYKKIAKNERYAGRLVRALRNWDLTKVESLFKQATSGFNSVSESPGGFVIGFPAAAPAYQISNANFVKGSARLTAAKLRKLAARILPLYLKISRDKRFAAKLAAAAMAGDKAALRRLIAPLIPNNRLVSVRGDRTSILMEIKVCNIIFVNQFFVQ